jgi:hypothetical protein
MSVYQVFVQGSDKKYLVCADTELHAAQCFRDTYRRLRNRNLTIIKL